MRKVFFYRFVVYTACHRQTHARCQTKFYGELSNQVQHFLQFLFKQICRCFVTEYFFRSTSASSRRSRGSIRKHLAVPYRRSLFRPRFARPYGLKRTKNQGVRHKCHSLFLWLAPCLALRSVPLMGTEIVTRLCLDISISRHSLSAIAIPSRTLSAPYDSPQLHQFLKRSIFTDLFVFRLAETTSSSLVKHAPHAVTMHARVSRHYRALPFPNLGARCKAAHISAMQKKPFLVQVVLGFSFSVGLSQCPFRSRRAACLFNHPPQCHKMSN